MEIRTCHVLKDPKSAETGDFALQLGLGQYSVLIFNIESTTVMLTDMPGCASAAHVDFVIGRLSDCVRDRKKSPF